MTDREKIMAGFGNLEADLKRFFGLRVTDPADNAAMVLSWVSVAHDRFMSIDQGLPEPEAEAVEISVDPAVGHVEG